MPTAQPLRTGDPRRLGDYELTGRLGEGGQGTVFLGSRGGETYAVKLLHGPVGDERAVFLREVELAKQVARFCTAQVIDAGFDEGRAYIVSEYVDGHSLHRDVMLTGPRSGGALERLAVGTATALAAIHRAGIVHRDFKPQNVLLGPDGPRVIDFGLARLLDAAATLSGRGVGTPAYMAPEQITASAVTGAADVFSWGATMCFAANATAPFGQDSVAPVLHRILTAPPELGRLSGRLRTLVAACLEKDARNRPASRELLLELLGEAPRDLPADVPAEVLRSPPPPILRTPPIDEPLARGVGQDAAVPPWGGPAAGAAEEDAGPADASPRGMPSAEPASPWGRPSAEPAASWGAAPAGPVSPLAEPEATGAPGAYHLPPATGRPGDHPASPGASDPHAGRLGSADPHAARPGASEPTHGDVLPPGLPPGGEARPDGGGRTERRGWPTAAMAACAAVLVTTVVLLVVILPAMTRTPAGRAGPQAAGPLASPPPTTRTPERKARAATSSPAKETETKRAGGAQRPAYDQPSAARPPTVTVPSVAGLSRAAAAKAVQRAGLAVGRITERDSPRKIGQVLSSTPAAGTVVARGSTVSLTVSAGVPVPSVTGKRRAAAEAALTGAGLKVGSVTRACSQAVDGTVLTTSPKAGRRVEGGTAVALTISRHGAGVPPVVGRPGDAARATLEAAGFSVVTRERRVDDESQAGLVLAQSVKPETCAKPGARIVITVGEFAQTGPDPGEPLEPPDGLPGDD